MATFAGEVEVTVVPDITGFGQRLEADTIAAATRAAEKIGRAMGDVIATRVANSVRAGLDRVGASAAGAKAGAEFGRTFGHAANAEIKKTLKTQQQVRVRVVADMSRARAEVDGFARTAGQRVGERVADGLRRGAEEGSREIPRRAPKAAEEYAGRFAATLKARLQAAFKALPDVKLDADSRPVDRAIAGIREELQTLANQRLDIDISTADATAKLTELRTRLARIATESPDVRVQVDAAAALAELAAVKAGVQWVDRKVAKVRVEAHTGAARAEIAAVGAAASMSVPAVGGLVAAVLTLGPALIPVAAAGAAAMAGIAMGAMAAAGAVGVLLLALWPVVQAVQAVTQAQGKSAASAASAASKTIGLANASDSLRAAQEGVAEASRRAAEATQRAERAVERAHRASEDAARSVLDAEQALADARREAARDQTELADRVEEGKLSERQAVLDLQRAQEDLRRVAADPTASAAQRMQAQLTYDEAAHHLEDLREGNADLARQQQDATRQGVDGAKKVTAAQRQLLEAKRDQKDAERDLTDARAAAVEQEQQNARDIAAAKQQVVQAQRAVQAATVSSSQAGGAALQTMRDKMAALTPEGRRFVLFLTGPMRSALSGLSGEAQRGFLPGLQSGMQSLMPMLPGLTRFVGDLAETMGNLAEQAGKALGGPWWRQFFGFIGQTAGPVLRMMGETIGNFIQGLAGLFQAMAPAGMDFGKGLLGASKAFAEFGKNAKNSKGFQDFLAAVRRDGPKVVAALKAFAAAVTNITRSLEPLGGAILGKLTDSLRAISRMNPSTIKAVAAALALLVVGLRAVTLAQWAWNIAQMANPVGLIIAGIIFAIGVIVAWGLALRKLYQENETFRNAVNNTWNAIKAAVSWTWQNVIKPAFEWITNFVMTRLVPAFLWLWRNVIVPAWSGIVAVISWAWTNVILPLLTALWAYVTRVLAPVLLWLYRNVVKPVWQAIGVAIQLAWSVIQVVFRIIELYIRNVLAPVFTWLYRNIIRPVWENLIRPAFRAFADFLGTYVVPAFRAGVAAIARAWDAVRDAAKTPIEFVIEQVINRGIIDTWNRIAGWFGVDPVDHIRVPWARGPASGRQTYTPGGGPNRAFAAGGPVWGPGTGTSDSIPAWLSNGEYVIPAEIVRRFGVEFFDLLRSGRVDVAGDSSSLVVRRFAEGGNVDGRRVAETRSWLPSVDPLPYVWGGVGPSSYDCSGLSGEVWNRVTGNPSYRRVFTTTSLLADPARFGLAPGRGTLTFGVSPTHMGGMLAGLGFEARGRQDGILIGSRARSTSTFPHEFFLHNIGGSHADAEKLGIDPLHPVDSIRRMLTSVLAPLASLRGSEWGRLISGMPRKAADAALSKLSHMWGGVEALQRLIPGYARGGPVLYDQGGWLKPGMTTVMNASGSPEPVFSSSQWDTLRAAGGGIVQASPVNVTSQVMLDGEPFWSHTHRTVRSELDRDAFRARVGRR